jgi:multidrug resistance efflux pump
MNYTLPRTILFGCWAIALASMVLMSSYIGGSSSSFYGIADDQEQTIRFKGAVEIISLDHRQGHLVAAGDVVLRVHQAGLESDLLMVGEQIQVLISRNRESRASMQSEIVRFEADLQEKVVDLDSQIQALEAKETIAQQYLDRLDRSANASRSVTRNEIESLKQRRQALTRATASRVDDLRSRLDASNRPINAQIAELNERREELRRRQSLQTVVASADGQIGSVHFKAGDVVPPYETILTLQGSHASFVRAYIHENVFNDIRAKQPIWVRSATDQYGDRWFRAHVESLGSRIVEFPDRLKVNPLVRAWGRAVVIRFDQQHDLLLGEKVQIQMEPPMSIVSELRKLWMD